MYITQALLSTSVHRLDKSWKSLPKKTLQTFTSLRNLASSNLNYANLREAIKKAQSPSIPYLGMYLKDLVFINDASNDFSESGLINWEKKRAIGK